MAGDNGHFLRKLCKAPTDLLSQHFSVAHAGQKRVGTVTCKSSVSSYFSMNRWVIWAIEIDVYFQPFAVLSRLWKTLHVWSFPPCPWPGRAAHPMHIGPSQKSLLNLWTERDTSVFCSYVQFTTLVDLPTFMMVNSIGTCNLFLSNEKYCFCSRATVVNIKGAKKSQDFRKKKKKDIFSWLMKTFTEQLDRKKWTL